MTAPPGQAPTTRPTAGHETADAFMAYLAREALRILRNEGVETTRHEALTIATEIARAQRLDLREMRNQAAGRLAVEEFRYAVREYAKRKARLSACDQRLGGPNWRLTS